MFSAIRDLKRGNVMLIASYQKKHVMYARFPYFPQDFSSIEKISHVVKDGHVMN